MLSDGIDVNLRLSRIELKAVSRDLSRVVRWN